MQQPPNTSTYDDMTFKRIKHTIISKITRVIHQVQEVIIQEHILIYMDVISNVNIDI